MTVRGNMKKTKKEKWEELDFNPIRDGYWATAERIKQRIAERQSAKRKQAVILWCVAILSLLILLFVLWLMI